MATMQNCRCDVSILIRNDCTAIDQLTQTTLMTLFLDAHTAILLIFYGHPVVQSLSVKLKTVSII